MICMEQLTEFSWKGDGAMEVAILEEFLCRGLPNLKKLDIEIKYHSYHAMPPWPRALESCNWPHLRSVRLVSPSGRSFESVEKFLAQHPHLEELSYYLNTDNHSAFTQQFLPNLRVLRTTLYHFRALLPKILSTALDTIEINHMYWEGITHVTSALNGHPAQSIAHLVFEPLVTNGDYNSLVAELPGLKSINGVSYEGDVELL
ncbi:hypothetical protein DL93DRAFT_1809603 [Clavulina sp. PMI_390]|nr:hypothetical protein DL93DRAFT_1809603 [Clavulina sp. PMI_390]